MKYFTFSCRDKLSDRGCAEVVVYALNIIMAKELLEKYLKHKGREDLLSDMKLECVMPNDIIIIYSSVEARS